MPKFLVTVVTKRWKKGEADPDGAIAENDGFAGKGVKVDAPDIASAEAEAKRISGVDEALSTTLCQSPNAPR